MSRSSDPDKATPPLVNRRRHPRTHISAPVTVQAESGVLTGFTENLSNYGISVHRMSALPNVGEECRLTLDLPLGQVQVRGKVVRTEPKNQKFAVDVSHVDTNGEVLLATILMGNMLGGS